jgi:hypothetical protein
MFLEMQVVGPVLRARVHGELHLGRAKDFFRQMLDEHTRSGTRKILIDCRHLRGALTPTQRYELGVHLFSGHLQMIEGGIVAPQIAVVAVPPLFDPGMLMESVATNRGAQFRAVQTLDDAARWLGIDPSSLEG